MSRRRKPNRRRPSGNKSSRTGRARHSRRSDRTQSAKGSALSEGSSLTPMSCVFYRPEVAVTTFQLSLAAEGRQLGRNQLSPVPVLVKGCERRFAIEDCGTIRLCTPSYYREDGESLVWDMQEGVIASTPRVHERWDDPADLEEQQRINAEMAGRLPLAKATGTIAATSLRVRETEKSTLTYGDNCLIWCSSVKPRNDEERSLWRASLEPSYDHISTIRDPRTFAQELGAMAFQQKGLLGNPISFRNPQTGYVAQCPSLSVVYGPVVYVDDRQCLHSRVFERFRVRGPQYFHQDQRASAPARIQVRHLGEPRTRRQHARFACVPRYAIDCNGAAGACNLYT